MKKRTTIGLLATMLVLGTCNVAWARTYSGDLSAINDMPDSLWCGDKLNLKNNTNATAVLYYPGNGKDGYAVADEDDKLSTGKAKYFYNDYLSWTFAHDNEGGYGIKLDYEDEDYNHTYKVVCTQKKFKINHWSSQKSWQSGWTITQQPTSTANGTAQRTCAGCGAVETVSIAADSVKPSISRATYISDSNGYWVYVYATDNQGINCVRFPTWTELNGQDDLNSAFVWSAASEALGESGNWIINEKSYDFDSASWLPASDQTYNYRFYVYASDHNNEPGPYITHIYAYDVTGNWSANGIGGIYLSYPVTYIDKTVDGKTLGSQTINKPYNSTVAGSDIGTSKIKGEYYSEYIYDSCTSMTVDTNGVTVYRYFKPAITIIFDANGGNGGPGTIDSTAGSIESLKSPTKTDYRFIGWNTKPDGTGSDWPSNNIVTNSMKDTTYYAQWELAKATITFHDNGGTGGAKKVKADIGKALTLKRPTRAGYRFSGYNTKEDGSGERWPSNNIVTKEMNNTDYYAQWSSGTDQSIAILLPGPEVNQIFSQLAGGDLSRIHYIHQVPQHEDGYESWEDNENAISVSADNSVIAWFSGESIFLYSEIDHIKMNANSSGMLANMTNLKDIGPIRKFDSTDTTDFSGIFKNDTSLTSLDLTAWITKSANNVTDMFNGCSNLSTIYADPNNWSITGISEYAQGKNVFAGCLSLDGYDASVVDVTKANFDDYLTEADADVDWTLPLKTMQWMANNQSSILLANTYYNPGYTFAGWNTEKDGSGTSYENAQKVQDLTFDTDGSTQLYAIWASNYYYINFNKNDEKATGTMEKQKMTYDDSIKLTQNAFSKTGYHLNSWNTIANGTGTSYQDQQEVKKLTEVRDSVVDLFAIWDANDYTVHFNSNWPKATGNMKDQAFVYDKAQTLTKNGFKRAGYIFDSWNTKEDLSGTKFTDGQNVKNLTAIKDGIVNLYASWTANNYTVKFDKNADDATGSMSDISFVYDQSQKLPANTFKRVGNDFNGWNTSADGSGTSYTDEQVVSNLTTSKDGVVTLYAQWNPATYIIQYSGNGSTSGTMPTTWMAYGVAKNLEPNQFVKTGYEFTGWKVTIDNVTSTYADKALVKNLTSEKGRVLTFIAQWKANSYSVVFDKNAEKATGSMNAETFTYDVAKKLSKNTYTNVGYKFSGWNTKPDGTGTTYTDEQNVQNLTDTVGGVVTLYAQWTPITYKIAFNANSGTGSMSEITVTYDKEITLPANTFKKTGYPFAGWNITSDGTGISYGNEASIMNLTSTEGQTVILYAQWTASVYYIRFHGGENVTGSMSDQPVTYDVKQKLSPNTFRKTGYSFNSWNSREDGKGTTYNDASEIYNLTDENNGIIHMYAQWKANQYQVKFDKNSTDATGTMANQTHIFDTAQTLTANTYTRLGYTFIGWNTKADGSGTKYSNTQEVENLTSSPNAIVTLYAQWKANAYTVNFDKNDEKAIGSMNPQPLTYDKAEPLTANSFSKVGYLFDKWNTKSDASGTSYADKANVKNLTTKQSGIVNLYAQWKPIHYIVRFDPNTDYATGSMADQSFTYDESQKLTPLGYDYEGYKFNGWNTKPDGTGTAYHDEKEVKSLMTKDGSVLTLYAQWQAHAYYIAFDGNGADSGSMGKQALAYDVAMAIAPNDFGKTGYHFTYWTLNADGTGTKIQDEEVVVNLTSSDGSTAVLYAQWAPNTYKVSYNKNASSATGTMDESTFTYDKEGTLKKNTYARVGYTFTGWNTQKDGTGIAYTNTATIKNLTPENNGIVTLYAQWKASTYSVIYNKNSNEAIGSTPSTKASYDEAIIISKSGYSRKGYTFSSWNTKSDGSGTSYPTGIEVSNLCEKNGDTITLYAQWVANTYSINFNKNATKATGAMSAQIIRYDTEMTLSPNTYAYTGYTFSGWNTEKDGSGTTYIDKATIKNLTSEENGSITLYAQWTPISYIVRFHQNADGVIGTMADQTFTFDKEQALIANSYSKEGYMFAGWAISEDSKEIVYKDCEAVKNLANQNGDVIDLYAVWSSIEYYVTFDGNESTSGSMDTITLTYDTKTTLPKNTYSRYGYKFNGWNTKADGTGAGYKDRGEVINLTNIANETITLYAQWKANKYTINYNPNSSSATGTMAVQEVNYGTETKLNPNKYIRPGYTFTGWNLRADGTGNSYTDEQTVLNLVMSDGDEITMYAQWSPITYNIAFDPGAYNTNGSMEPQKFAYDQKAPLNANQYTRDGYLFESWNTTADGSGTRYNDKEAIENLGTIQDETITLYAQWGHSKYYIAFHGNGNTAGSMATQEFIYGEKQDLAENAFIKSGFTFSGWNTKEDGSGISYGDKESIYNAVTTAGEVLDLYAQWDCTTSTVTYELNGGSWAAGYTAPTSHPYDESLTLPTAANIKRTGFIFLGWYENSGFTGTCYTQLPANTGDKTLYAAWYNLSDKKNGISKPIKNQYEYGN